MHDSETPEATPTFNVVELLAKEQAQWVVFDEWEALAPLLAARPIRATNYYEIDLDEILGREGFQQDIQDAFRYFWLFFRMQAFRRVEQEWQGKRHPSVCSTGATRERRICRAFRREPEEPVFTQVFQCLRKASSPT